MKMRLTRTALAALCGILTLTAGIARADITLERTMSVEGVGAMAFGNMSGTSKTTISGDKSRTDSDVKMKSKIIGFLARNAMGPSAEIILLDQDKLYHLNINKKQYTETTFEQMRAQLQKASDQMNSADGKKQPSAVDQSKCEWLSPKADVKKTGEKAHFAESAEAQKNYKAHAAKLGIDPTNSQDVSQRAKALFSQYKGIWTEIAARMQNVKGYPVKTSFTLALGGAQC